MTVHEWNVSMTFVGLVKAETEEAAEALFKADLAHFAPDVLESNTFHSETCTCETDAGAAAIAFVTQPADTYDERYK